MKMNVEKHAEVAWYYAVVRWEGYGVFTTWERAREECDSYSDNKKKKFKTFEETKAYAEKEYGKMHGEGGSYYIEEIKWVDYFYQRMMKREVAGAGAGEFKTNAFPLKICYDI